MLIPDEAQMMALGHRLARALRWPLVIHLQGPLGAGKTTLVRALLRGLGHRGPVPSPTYTLVESYQSGGRRVHHFDLYRLADPEELELIGLRDYLDEEAVCLFEWPERGEGVLPRADLELRISPRGKGRELEVVVHTGEGEAVARDAGLQ
ncbi:MAG: tRNA (adenosine(37)-N6)-threonylcarbamoyltransferase complex ATPase subunit type 1 TsaE [Gammaproteobacteria bacterium]|nr:MAG: tRNA (adenosine(37)-N6)-threonylcarbamoyltransferase complex ATPase subunit type 1 TsaE [Gammaproteobacteria bacterium]